MEGVLEAKLLKESMTQTEITREIGGSGGWGVSTKNLLWEGNEYFLEQHNFFVPSIWLALHQKLECIVLILFVIR